MLRHSLHNSITIVHRFDGSSPVTFWRGEKPVETRYPSTPKDTRKAVESLKRLYGEARVYEGAR